MEQFLVPQFIETESKIIGPITTRQFLIMMVAGMLDFIFYKIFFFNTFIIISLLNTAIFGLVAFFRINGMPFHYFFINLVQTIKKPRLRIWNKESVVTLVKEEKEEIKKEFIPKPELEGSKLSSLSLTVNTGGAFKEED